MAMYYVFSLGRMYLDNVRKEIVNTEGCVKYRVVVVFFKSLTKRRLLKNL